MSPRVLLASSVLLLGLCSASSLPAQSVPTRTLGVPEARLDHEWTKVSALRELRDGRVIILDTHDNVIMLVDGRFLTVTQIGREGQGPGEFSTPTALLALGGDSTGVYDMSNQGLKIITPRGTPGGILYPRGGVPCNAPGDTLTQSRVSTTIDGQGRFYLSVAPVRTRPDGTSEIVDSSAIVRWGAGCGRDTLAYLHVPIDPTARIMPGGGMISRPGAVTPFRSGIQWKVAPDGRVAIVDPVAYRVAMVDPNGARRLGPQLNYTPVRVTEAHKEAWRAEARAPSPGLVRSREGAMVRAMVNPGFTEPESWPRDLPAFLYNALSMGLDGRLWVQRTTAAGAPPTFDVFGAQGQLVERVTFPARTRLVGHGRGVVYLVRIDEDDLEYLERHRVTAGR